MYLFLLAKFTNQYIDDESIFFDIFINILCFYNKSESFFCKNFFKIIYQDIFCTNLTESDSLATTRKTSLLKSKAKN